MMFLLGMQAMFWHDPPTYFRSITATRWPCPAKVQAAIVPPVPPPRITRSYSSGVLFCGEEMDDVCSSVFMLLSFLSEWLRLGLHGFDEIRRRGTFERKAVANLSYDAFFQRLDKVCPRVASRHFRRLQVHRCQLTSTREGLPIAYDLGNHTPSVSGLRRHWMWVQQKRLRSSRSSTITPGGEDSIPGNNATRKVGQIIERRTFARHDHVGKQGIFGVHMGAAFDSSDDRHPDICQILEDLNTLVVHLAPNLRVGDVAK